MRTYRIRLCLEPIVSLGCPMPATGEETRCVEDLVSGVFQGEPFPVLESIKRLSLELAQDYKERDEAAVLKAAEDERVRSALRSGPEYLLELLSGSPEDFNRITDKHSTQETGK